MLTQFGDKREVWMTPFLNKLVLLINWNHQEVRTNYVGQQSKIT